MFHDLGFSVDSFLPFMIFAVPIVAIIGGITAGIVKTLGHQRIIELAQRERIAAIERGVDPSKLAPLPIMDEDNSPMYRTYAEYALRRTHGLMIGGVVTLAVGLGLMVFLMIVAREESGAWAVGLIPAMVGVALLISAWVIRPKKNDQDSTSMPRP